MAAAMFALVGGFAGAQQVVTYYSYPSAYAERQLTYMAPAPVVAPATVVYRPVMPPAVAVAPLYAPLAPQVVTTYRPVVAVPPPVMPYSPMAVTTTRYRPILGGTVTRTHVGYAPPVTYVVP